MSSVTAWITVWIAVTTHLTDGLHATQRREKQKTSFVAAAAGSDASSHAVHPASCLVNGIALFEGAAWSPDPCSVCKCRNRAVRCHAVACPALAAVIGAKRDIASQGWPGRMEVKPHMTLPPALPQTQAPPQKKRQEVAIKPAWSDWKPVIQTPPRFMDRTRFDSDDHDDDDYMDDDSDIDEDEDDDGTFLNSYSRQWRIPSATRPAGYTASQPARSPPRRPLTPPTKENVAAPKIPLTPPTTQNVVPPRRPLTPPTRQNVAQPRRPLIPPTRQNMAPPRRPLTPPTRQNTAPPIRPLTPPTRQNVAPPPGPVVPGGRQGQRGNRRAVSPNAQAKSLPWGCLLAASLIACGGAGLRHMPLLQDTGVHTLYLADNKISKIPARALAGLPNLEWLDLSKNYLDDTSLGLDVFKNLTNLRRLNLDGNNLTKIPPLPPSLLELKINDNKLSGLTPHSFKGLTQLLTLELEDNHFHDGNVSPLAFRALGKLIYLRLDDNDFRAIPSGLPALLQELHLADNKIEVVHAGLLNKTVNLRVLNLRHNKIREDRIAPRAWEHLRKLEALDLSHNKLVHVPSFLPVGLRMLILHHNQIERIPGYVFGHLRPGLDSLHLSYNRLREDGVSEVSFLGLYHSLTELLLDHNHFWAIPRGILHLQALQNLRLNHNYIRSVSMNSLCDTAAREDSPLLSVHLENNLIDRRLIPPSALSCIRNYHSVLLQPQRHEQMYE